MSIRFPRVLVITVSVLLILLILVGVTGVILVRRPFPQTKDTLSLPGLYEQVDVFRDSYGVPHIYATNAHDLFMAQGFVHAQDRFWQMEFWRRSGTGTLSEILGSSALDSDRFIRTVGWHRTAVQELELYNETELSVLDAYAEGVNAYIEQNSGSLGLEFTILGLTGVSFDPEPWTPLNTLTYAKLMAWDLGGNRSAELTRAQIATRLGTESVNELMPPYNDDYPTIVGDVVHEASLAAIPEDAFDLNFLGFGEGIGSNNWVISGERTESGKPILADDTHLGIQMPSIWYEVGLHCEPISPECPFNVVGFSFASSPGVIIGHNDHIAWGVTNLGPDVQDLFIEKINPADPNQYEVNGAWVDMDVHEETIKVAGGDSVTIEVKATRHGPIISDAYGDLDDFSNSGVETPEPYAIALRWTALDTNPGIVETFIGLDIAANFDDFRAALRSFSVPAQNVVYADIEGNIGYQSPGRIPIRANGDGTLPVPGWTDEYEWTGDIPFDELPRSFSPESGYIVTANNAVIDDDYPFMLTYDWNFGYRARRIVDLVGSNPGIGLDEHASIQFDSYSLNAEQVLPYLAAMDSPLNAVFSSWDLGSNADSSGAAAFSAVWARTLEFTFHDDLPEDYWPNGAGRWFYVVGQMLEDPTDPFWDDQATSETEDRDAILQRSLDEAHSDLTGWFGDDPEGWSWGEMHGSTFRNQTLGESGIGLIEDRFNRGPFPTSGGADLVNATGWTAYEGFETTWLPSMRMLVDLGDLSRSLTTHTTGQSGHTDHPHYDDMIPLWLAGEYSPMNWTRAQVDEATETVQMLVPGK